MIRRPAALPHTPSVFPAKAGTQSLDKQIASFARAILLVLAPRLRGDDEITLSPSTPRPHILRPLACAASLLAASAGHTAPANDPDAPLPTPEMRVAYACDDGSNFTVRFRPDSADAVIETGPTKGLILPQQTTASGFDYTLPTHSLRGKGATVTWTIGRKAPAQCRGRSMGSAR